MNYINLKINFLQYKFLTNIFLNKKKIKLLFLIFLLKSFYTFFIIVHFSETILISLIFI